MALRHRMGGRTLGSAKIRPRRGAGWLGAGRAIVGLLGAAALVALIAWLPSLTRDAGSKSGGAGTGVLRVGDAFEVEYLVSTIRAPQQSGGSVIGAPLRRVWRYGLQDEEPIDGRMRRTFVAGPLTADDAPAGLRAAEAGGAGPSTITITVDADTRALVTLREALPGPRPPAGGMGMPRRRTGSLLVVDHPNRYAVGGPEAVLFAPRRFSTFIAELPRLPSGSSGSGASLSRTVERADGLLPAFEQRLSAAPDGGWEVELRRLDPDSGRELRVWQHWPAEATWWSAARVTLGDELLIEGRWLGPARGSELWLPRVLAGAESP